VAKEKAKVEKFNSGLAKIREGIKRLKAIR
jgi:hypothetical protein